MPTRSKGAARQKQPSLSLSLSPFYLPLGHRLIGVVVVVVVDDDGGGGVGVGVGMTCSIFVKCHGTYRTVHNLTPSL